MPSNYRVTAADAATLTVHLVQEFDREKTKTSTRVRISQATLRAIANRVRLRGAFVDEWIDELDNVGWSAFPVGDHFGIIRTETTEGWVRIGSKRIRETLKFIHAGKPGVLAKIEAQIVAPPAEADDD